MVCTSCVTFWISKVSVSFVCRKFLLVDFPTLLASKPYVYDGVAGGHEVVMRDLSSTRVRLKHPVELQILCGALSKAKSAFALFTHLMLAFLKVIVSLVGETSWLRQTCTFHDIFQ